jgi:alpha-2-macroglobulin receptor-associated protein
VIIVLTALLFAFTVADKPSKKYSKEANVKKTTPSPPPELKLDIVDFNPSDEIRNLHKPFRMAKLNLVWSKAIHRLTEPKLRSLFMELKIQDKEELAWKQLSSQHKDKDGLKEADLRKKLTGIMSTYDLLEHFDDTQNPEKTKHHKAFEGPVDNYVSKAVFKDKKLNKLWTKAELSGFTPEELITLKQEFSHHQEKIDLYYNLLENIDTPSGKSDHHENAVNEDELDNFNEIAHKEEGGNVNTNEVRSKHKNYEDKSNQLREKHREIRNSFDNLERAAAKGPNNQDFVEPKVKGLWRVALTSNFSPEELASLKVELLHYESRLMKLRHMMAEQALHSEKYKVRCFLFIN